MRMSFQLGRLFGIAIRINYTWFLIFALVALSLGVQVFPEEAPGASPVAYWAAAVLGSLLVFGSVLAHELAHSLAARARGVPVRDITLFIFGGVASIEREMEQPGEEFLMAGVGPATSLALAGLFALVNWLLGPLNMLVGSFFSYLAVWNLGVALFNLIPGLPLDGGRLLRAVIWRVTGNYRRATGVSATIGRLVAFLMIGGGILWTFAGNLNGLWLAFIGWFLDNAATQSYRHVLLQESLRGVTVADLMTQECEQVGRGLSVSSLVNDLIFPHGRRCFVVTEEGQLKGLVTVHSVREIPREMWPYTPVGEVMTPYDDLVVAHPEEDAFEVLRRMDERNVNQVPVEEHGVFLGLLGRDSLLRYVRTRAELTGLAGKQ